MDPDLWYSQLSMTQPSLEDMEHVKEVCREFNIITFRDWHDLYLKIDVFGLADAFEEFRTFSQREFGLDPVGYLGLPGLGWDGLLLLMKKRGLPPLDTLQDPGMYRFFEKAMYSRR